MQSAELQSARTERDELRLRMQRLSAHSDSKLEALQRSNEELEDQLATVQREASSRADEVSSLTSAAKTSGGTGTLCLATPR